MAVRQAHLRTVPTPACSDRSRDRQLDLLGSRFTVKYLATANSRFDSLVVPVPFGCHVWTAAKDADGYGRYWLGERAVAAHRFAYERTKGIIPEGMQVDHICRGRACVNPDHLQLVTPQQNAALARIRAGKASAYRWQDARNDRLAVDLVDPVLSESDSPSKLGASAWVPPLADAVWSQLDEGWSDPRFHN